MANNQPTNDQSRTKNLKDRLNAYKNWFASIKWNRASEKDLELSEKKILNHLTKNCKLYYVDIDDEQADEHAKNKQTNDESSNTNLPNTPFEENSSKNFKAQVKNEDESRKIWTLEMECDKTDKTPILMLHGFNLALAVWVLNLDSLSEVRKVWAIDILGFGRSSRPKFKVKNNPELDLVESIELWRKKVGLNKFILLGHSFGGYIAASYAIKYGDNLNRLILVDPWGFSDKEDIILKAPIWFKGIMKLVVATNTNPMSHLRYSGPIGKKMIKVRDDIRRKYEPKLKDDSFEIMNYLYHCNALKASGELIFKQICTSRLISKRPIIWRANEFSSHIKLTVLYGDKSWLHKEEEETLKRLFPNNSLDYKIFAKSGHHIYSDEPEEFNSFLNTLD